MVAPYIGQKVRESVELLIGEETPENRERLIDAILRARLGANPANRETLGREALDYLAILEEGTDSDREEEMDFHKLVEAYLGYVKYAYVDEGREESVEEKS